MLANLGSVETLISEYETLIELSSRNFSATDQHVDSEELRNLLTTSAEWTPSGASALVSIVNNYGAFMLRNALALSIVLGIEDGDLGF